MLKNIRSAQFWDSLLTHPALRPIGIFLIVFGCKLWLIHVNAVSCPFWDDWGAEGVNAFKPWLEHNLNWSNLVVPHNEHRLFMSRLLGLTLLKLNGLWNSKLEMIAGSALHSLTAVILYLQLRKSSVIKSFDPILTILVIAVFAMPFGSENTLMGLQSQIYFVLFFSVLSIISFSQYEPLSAGWFGGVLFSVAAYLSLAAGFLPLLAATALIFTRLLTARDFNRRSAAAVLLLLGIAIVAYHLTPTIAGHSYLKASSPLALVGSVAYFLSAPYSVERWPAVIIWLPFMILLVRLILRRKDPSKQDRLILGLGFLFLLEAVALGYGRGALGASRYCDLLLPGVLVNFAALGILFQTSLENYRRQLIFLGSVLCCLLFTAFVMQSIEIDKYINYRRVSGKIQEDNVRGYLVTNDFAYLKDKPWSDIPFPNADSLKGFLDDPSIRNILPSSIRPAMSGKIIEDIGEGFGVDGYNSLTPPLPNETVYGSYGKLREKQKGKALIEYRNEKGVGWVRIFVSGYPGSSGQSLRLRTADGIERKLFYLSANPGERWSSAYARVSGKGFQLEAEDADETHWFAFTAPKEEGRLGLPAEVLLKSWVEFLRPGLIILFLSFFYQIFSSAAGIRRPDQ